MLRHRASRLLAVLLVCLSSAASADGRTPTDRQFASAAPPRGNLPGWRLAYLDTFSGSRLDPRWFRYGGTPGGDPYGQWSGTHVRVSGGALQLRGYRDARFGGKFTTAGVSSHALAQTYGKWLVRFRVDAGQGVAFAALLWPERGPWPPEIDFAEDNGTNPRRVVTASLHHSTPVKQDAVIRATRPLLLTRWHVLGVEWTPGHVVYTVDGRAWARMSGSAVPRVPMRLALQTQAWNCGETWERCPDRTTPARVDMVVDWIAIYRREQAV